MLVVASFMNANMPEGSRMAYSLSELDEKGRIVKENIRGNFIVLDKDLQVHIDAIRDYIIALQEG